MAYERIDEVVARRGGKLSDEQFGNVARFHLHQTRLLLAPFLEPTIVGGPGQIGTSVSPPSRISEFVIVNRWNVGAFAALAEEKPVVIFHAGVPFALCELFYALMAVPQILERFDSDAESDSCVSPRTSFEHVLDIPDSSEDLIQLWSSHVAQSPQSETRRAIAQQMYVTASYFLFLHELGHIDLGHLELLNRYEGTSTISECGPRRLRPHKLPDHAKVFLEHEADSYAAMMLLQSFVARSSTRFVGQHLDVTSRAHVLLIAIASVLVYLEFQSKSSANFLSRALNRFTGSSGHPELSERVYVLFGAIQTYLTSTLDIPERAAAQIVRNASGDLAIIADLLDLGGEFQPVAPDTA